MKGIHAPAQHDVVALGVRALAEISRARCEFDQELDALEQRVLSCERLADEIRLCLAARGS